jgi:putative alpha-1,2-mannosidase
MFSPPSSIALFLVKPDIMAPFLFSFVDGASVLTQYHVRRLCINMYNDQADGIPGNDDYGTMSAWLLASMLGLYPLTTTGQFAITSPLVSNATWALETGVVSIVVHNQAMEDRFVEKVTVDGIAVDLATKPFIEHSALAKPGTVRLEFWLTDTLPSYGQKYASLLGF